MNKLAQVSKADSLERAITETAVENDFSNSERLFLKKKMENEIRVKLAEFANEISKARHLRPDK